MRSNQKISIAVFGAVCLMVPGAATAQDISSCAEVNSLAQAGDIADALWELDACKRGLETLWYDGMVDALNVPIDGLAPSGGEVEGVLGIMAVTIYHGDIKTTFTSGTGGSESPMAGLGALASLGAAFGVREAGVEEVRLGRRMTGRLEEKSDGTFSLMVSLDEGVLLQEGPDRDQLQAVATEAISILTEYFQN